MAADWSEISPASFGAGLGRGDSGSGGVTQGVESAVTSSGPAAPVWSPDNPLFWLGALVLVITGAITLSTTDKLGPLRVSAKA